MEEALQWQSEYMAKGAIQVELKPENDRTVVDVLLTLDKRTANDVVGYEVQPEEWLLCQMNIVGLDLLPSCPDPFNCGCEKNDVS